MGRLSGFFAMFAAILLLSALCVSAQNGYGTSSISVTQSSVSLPLGGSATLGYNVTLASGRTWGTNLQVTNQAQLAAQGITISMTNAQGDPPFSGALSILTSHSTAPGNYTLTLAATGDDPSIANVTVRFSVVSAGPAPTTTVSQGYGLYPSLGSGLALELYAAAAVIALAAALFMVKMKSAFARLVVLGVVLILEGIAVWLYGDYAGGLAAYIWGGFAAIALGIIIWLAGDYKGKMFSYSRPALFVALGVIVILAGTGAWLYGDYGGVMQYVWDGVVAMLLGAIVWLYADYMIGAFAGAKRRK
jgi:hypothetical protein